MMSGWRVARCLLVLLDQVDAIYPGRYKASDGTIGDALHTVGDHVPDVFGIVRALDLTNDPTHGFDIDPFSDLLQRGRDPRISYVIANRMIMSGNNGPDPWLWRNYGGSDPHTGHIHISVVSDSSADRTDPWNLGGTNLMAEANEIIQKWAQGIPRTADGELVCPVEWRVRDEAWQKNMDAKIAALVSALAAVRTDLALLKSGGVDVVAVADAVVATIAARAKAMIDTAG